MIKKIPITIITGFLGAGKTTFLNRIIKSHSDKKLAIIENEFGEIGIDSDIVVGVENDSLFELANGCICCSSNAEFGIVINNLIHANKGLDHILVETTGIANPSGVIESLIGDSFIMQKIEIDSVICLIDAAHITEDIDKSIEAQQQIVMADLVMLNKVDLIDGEEEGRLVDIIRKYNPSVKIIKAEKADYGTEPILNRQSFTPPNVEKTLFDFSSVQPTYKTESQHGITSFSFEFKGSFNANKFPFWLGMFLQNNRDKLHRIKGIINYDGVYEKMLLQAVRGAHQLVPMMEQLRKEERICKLVFIGTELDQEKIKEDLEKMLL